VLLKAPSLPRRCAAFVSGWMAFPIWLVLALFRKSFLPDGRAAHVAVMVAINAFYSPRCKHG